MATDVPFTLRALRADDAPPIAALIGDWEVVRWLSAPPHPYAVSDADAFIMSTGAAEAAGDSRTSAIEIDGSLAGIVGLDRRSRGMNLGYWLGRAYWGRGIVSRAAAMVTDAFFANTSETVLNSGYFSGNERSAAIQRRLGFLVTGDGLLFNRPSGQRLPHIETVLTRERHAALMASRGSN